MQKQLANHMQNCLVEDFLSECRAKDTLGTGVLTGVDVAGIVEKLDIGITEGEVLALLGESRQAGVNFPYKFIAKCIKRGKTREQKGTDETAQFSHGTKDDDTSHDRQDVQTLVKQMETSKVKKIM